MAALEVGDTEITLKDLRPLAIPGAALVVVVLLYFFGFRIALGQIRQERQELDAAMRDETVLEQKQQVLTDISGNVLSFVNASTDALPDKNPSLTMISQIKQLASQRLLVISDLNIGRAVEEGSLFKVQLQFDVDGDLTQVTAFVRDLAGVAPLSRLESVNLNQSGDLVRASVSVVVYSAPFPEELPPLTEPLSDLTNNEEEVLGILSGLQAPPFSTGVSPSQPTGERTNPFE